MFLNEPFLCNSGLPGVPIASRHEMVLQFQKTKKHWPCHLGHVSTPHSAHCFLWHISPCLYLNDRWKKKKKKSVHIWHSLNKRSCAISVVRNCFFFFTWPFQLLLKQVLFWWHIQTVFFLYIALSCLCWWEENKHLHTSTLTIWKKECAWIDMVQSGKKQGFNTAVHTQYHISCDICSTSQKTKTLLPWQ